LMLKMGQAGFKFVGASGIFVCHNVILHLSPSNVERWLVVARASRP